ncbi:alpha/beta fold hydrolase [Dyella sp. BiH032]|uniref:alpha/beta hydrolase family protein n=1 Tax=Dyella sp. BiH032 TaxID=3075430 RepID=UPI0028937241|nr:alpha/beta fold hydrolase [Dyella sp. BiH032]WNL44118.1 alpha/beta fold hydrolase [Dyella sp. BiH032]
MPVRDDVIHITMRGRELAGTLISPAPRMPGVLMVHGWGGSQRQYRNNAHQVAALGCVCLTFDLTGHVATASQRDTVSREENLHDMLAAYDFLAAHPLVERDSIAVVGSSYGGYLAALLTERRSVRWLGLRAPAIYKDEDWTVPKRLLARVQQLPDYRRRPIEPEDNRALRACAHFTGDVLIVESEHDEIVPGAVLASYRKACENTHSLTYRVIRGADHSLTDETSREAYGSILSHWLEEMMLGAKGQVRAAASKVRGSAKQETPLRRVEG